MRVERSGHCGSCQLPGKLKKNRTERSWRVGRGREVCPGQALPGKTGKSVASIITLKLPLKKCATVEVYN